MKTIDIRTHDNSFTNYEAAAHLGLPLFNAGDAK